MRGSLGGGGRAAAQGAPRPCTQTAHFFVPKAAIRRLKVGNGLDEGVDIGPLVSTDAVAKVEELMEEKRRGGDVVVGGGRHELGGSFFEPTLVVNVKDDSSVR